MYIQPGPEYVCFKWRSRLPLMDIAVIMLDGTPHRVRVNPEDTVGSLKAKIHNLVEVPPAKQLLVLVNGDQKKTLSDDSRYVSQFGLQPGSRISLLLTEPASIQVILKNQNGKLSKYDVRPDEIVKEFKQKVEAKEGVQASQQRLLHQSREMMNDQRLSDYNVADQSTIELMLHLRGG